MPKKKNTPNKSDFVRGQPLTLSASDVVAKAKEAGMVMTSALVYQVRASAAKSKGKAKRGAAAGAAPGTPAAAAAAPTGRVSNGKMSASEFIRSMPESMKAKAVAKKGNGEGYTFKAGLVYQVRRAQKRNKGKVTRLGRPPKSAATGSSSGSASSHRAIFRKLMIRIGLDQAEALFADVHTELKTIEDHG